MTLCRTLQSSNAWISLQTLVVIIGLSEPRKRMRLCSAVHHFLYSFFFVKSESSVQGSYPVLPLNNKIVPGLQSYDKEWMCLLLRDLIRLCSILQRVGGLQCMQIRINYIDIVICRQLYVLLQSTNLHSFHLCCSMWRHFSDFILFGEPSDITHINNAEHYIASRVKINSKL